MKQRFYHKTYTRTKVVNNILRVYNQRTEADCFDWYAEANQYAVTIAQRTGYTPAQAAGVIAALSPLKRWDENKRIALQLMEGGRPEHTKAMVSKARAIMQTTDVEEIATILNGLKITAFFLNILNPEDSTRLTIDRHAMAIAVNTTFPADAQPRMSLKQYQFFVQCYQIAGEKAGIPAIKMQAITWEAWRRLKGITQEINYDDVPF